MRIRCKTEGIIIAYQARIVDFRYINIQIIEEVPDFIVVEQVQDIIDSIVHD